MDINQNAATTFTETFFSQSLEKQIKECDSYTLSLLFESTFMVHQPVLEAGCGSGKWCAWFHEKNIKSDGIDWSAALMQRAQITIPTSNFFTGDMRDIPKPDKFYGGIIALGSIEHSIEGPLSALNEFYRVLRDDGRAIITVPYGGLLKRTIRLLQKPSREIKSNKYIRLLFGKSPDERTLSEAKVNTIRTWYPRFLRGKEGCYFFEYEFNKCQMRKFIQEAGFEIINEFVEFGNEGILHNFGKIAGKWNSDRCDVDFTFVGKYLRRILPVSISGAMLCLVIRKL